MVAKTARELPRRQHRKVSSVDMVLYFSTYQSLLGFVFERVFIGETSTLVRPFRWTSLLPSVLLAMSITPKTTSDAPHNHRADSRSPYRILPKTPCDGRDRGGVDEPDRQHEPMASHPNTPRLGPQNTYSRRREKSRVSGHNCIPSLTESKKFVAQLMTVVVVEPDCARALRCVENITAFTANIPQNASDCIIWLAWPQGKNRQTWEDQT